MSLNRKVTVPVGTVRRDLAIKPKPRLRSGTRAGGFRDTIPAVAQLAVPRSRYNAHERQTSQAECRGFESRLPLLFSPGRTLEAGSLHGRDRSEEAFEAERVGVDRFDPAVND